ncbi:unnamed protein product, partial [Ceratitis capitata]
MDTIYPPQFCTNGGLTPTKSAEKCISKSFSSRILRVEMRFEYMPFRILARIGYQS